MEKKMESKLQKLLLKLGIAPNLVGFKYVCTAVCMIIDDPTVRITEIYNYISEENKCSDYCVQRGIKYAISKVDDAGKELLGFDYYTNSEFLYALALKMKIEEEEG